MPTASFLDITLAAIKGIGRHRRRRVPEGVERAVRGHELRRLRRDRASHLPDLPPDLLRREIRAEAGDRLQLVQRPARVPEPAARELRDRESERGGDRARTPASRRPRPLRSSACPRPAVARDRRSVDRVPRFHHRPGEREGLLRVEPTQQTRHQERGRQRIRDLTPRVTLDEGPDLSSESVLPSRLAATIVRGSFTLEARSGPR